MPKMKPLLTATNLEKTHHQGEETLTIFKNISLTLNAGEIVALVGPSGAGKSTLLQMIGLLDKPTAGQIAIDGKIVSVLDDAALTLLRRNTIGFVYQFHFLQAEFSAEENVMIPQLIAGVDKAVAKQKADKLLDQMGLGHRLHHRPARLSGGEQQRVAIARALSVMPKLLLLDEPFSNLDYSRKMELRERLFNYAKEHELSVMISTHEIQEILPWTDQIIVLQEGRLIQNDNAEERVKLCE